MSTPPPRRRSGQVSVPSPPPSPSLPSLPPSPRHRCSFVPPYLLAALAMGDDPVLAARATRTLERDTRVRAERERPIASTRAFDTIGPAAGDAGPGLHRTVHDAANGEQLPGAVVREEGAAPTADVAVTEAYDGLGDTWSLYSSVFARDSLDGKGLPLLASVHYSRDYDNAFWDGDQMVFGDGDGEVFGRFTASVEVIGHELTHGVTDYTAGLRYQGQSGALNESISDVFGVLVKQKALGQDAAAADWLIGADLLLPGVEGVALRSMAAPGTAYDDPVLGQDPQPGHLDDYVATMADNGGVHINSGIPNKAFQLVATAVGGPAWEAPGKIWFAVLTGAPIRADCDFATFASLTEAAAGELYGAESAPQRAVRSAWQQVGVTAVVDAPSAEPSQLDPVQPDPGPADPGPADHLPVPTPPVGPPGVVTVRRSGGVTGRTLECTVALEALPVEQAQAWTSLLGGGRLQQMVPGADHPDAFSYQVLAGGQDVTVSERDLPDDVRTLLRRTLRQS